MAISIEFSGHCNDRTDSKTTTINPSSTKTDLSII